MRSNSANKAATDRVFLSIKARVIGYEFRQGQRIYLDPIAKALGVSTTPVRDAMNRLAAEGLVIKAPMKGFIAMTLSEENLMGQYEFTRYLLTLGLERLEPATRRNLPGNEPIADVLRKINRRVLFNSNALADYTGAVFAAIAALTEKSAVVLAINRANDHLYFIRTQECQHLGDVQSELKYFCELLLADRCEELKAAIHAYHDRREALLPTLLDDLSR